jgi:hypothetical protein
MNYKINIKYKNKQVSPILELYKGKLFSYLIKSFINDCINSFGTNIFTIKKSFSRTLTNLFSSWIFTLYITYDFSSDYFFPTNYHDTESLEYTLRDLCKYDSSITDIDEKINNIITKLKENYKYQLTQLEGYQESLIYKNNIHNYKINKTIINVKKNQTNKEFYKLEMIVPFIIKDKRLQNTLNNILIPSHTHDKLYQKYTGRKNKFNDYLWAIIFRYQLLGSNNHQLAVLPNIMNEMNKDYELNFECFASAINSTFDNYCSIYYDLEQYFGSVGSFYNLTLIEGTYGFNPPYQKQIIESGINKILQFLESDNLTFIITIPIWDTNGRAHMKQIYNNEIEKQNIDYGEFEIINKIKESKYFKGLRMISKENFTYIDHNFELYKNKTIQNTYVIILSNKDINIDYLNKYNFEEIINQM